MGEEGNLRLLRKAEEEEDGEGLKVGEVVALEVPGGHLRAMFQVVNSAQPIPSDLSETPSTLQLAP